MKNKRSSLTGIGDLRVRRKTSEDYCRTFADFLA
jgi:hypothetical protein